MSIRERVQQKRFESAASEAIVSLVVAADHFTRESDELCARHGITGDQLNVLRILRGAHPGGHARGEITRRLMRRSPDVTRMLDRLERQGLIARGTSPEDRRLSVAAITPTGLELLERIAPELNALMERFTAPLGETDLRELARLCDALVL